MAARAAGGLASQRWTVPSKLVAASCAPEGENATEYTSAAGPIRVAMSAGCAGWATFHIHTVPSVTPTARVLPSGLKVAAQTYPDGPVSGAPIWTGCAGWATFHSRTVLSALPTARILLS